MISRPNVILTPPPIDDKTSKSSLQKQQPKQQIKPQASGFQSFGIRGANTSQPQPSNYTFNNKPNENSSISIDSKTNKEGQLQIPANNSSIEGAKGNKSLGQDKKGANKIHSQYVMGYNTKSCYDILNQYYHVNENPGDMKSQTILNISRVLFNLIRHKPESIQGYTFDKIQLPQLRGTPQLQTNKIKNFLLSVVIYFIRDHPYCSFDGVQKLVQYHVKQNLAIYVKNGVLNLQLFKLHGILDGFIDTSSKFYINIQKALQTTMTVFANQFCSIVRCIPQQHADNLLGNKPEIVTNIMICFKALYNADYAFIHLNYAHQQVGLQLINILLLIHRKCPSIFDKPFVRGCIEYLDRHLYLICKNPSAYNPFHEDKSTSTILGKKCIQLCNCLTLRFPYQLVSWDQQIKKTINSTKSQWMFPFKWLLADKASNQIFSINARFDDQQMQMFHRTQYFTILGREWFLLLKALIKNEKDHQSLSINEYYKDTVFYLLCSVIEQNPFNFWTNSDQNKQIYEYISGIYADVANNSPDSPVARLSLGKLCRILLCACGKSMIGQNSSEISQQILNSFKKDSILFSVLREGENSQSVYNLQLCNYVFNYFANNIISYRGLTKQKLFGPLILAAVVQSSQASQQDYYLYDSIGNVDAVKLKYHYELPTVAYELIIRIINDNPNLIFALAPLWNREYDNIVSRDDENDESEQSSKVMMNTFLWKITFDYVIKVEEYCYTRKLYTHHNQHADTTKIREYFQVVPLALELLGNLLKNKHTQQLVVDFLQEEHIYNNQRLRQVLERSVIFQSNVSAIAKHIQTLYQLDIHHIPWITRTCNPIMQQSFDLWEIDVVKHYANVVRIVITQKYLQPSSKYALNWSNLLSLDPRNELLGSSLKNMDSYNLKIHQLNQYSEYLLPFIIWALKVEEDNLREFYFYNSLYISRNYDTLGAALKLLEVLVVIYIRYHDRIYIPQKLKRFLSIFSTSRQFNLTVQTLTSNASTSTVNQQIQLSNKKVATLPAVLAFLISSPTLLSPSQFKQHNYPKAKQVRSIALNILTMIISSNSNMSSILSTLQEKKDNQLFTEDSISNVNFNVYESMFVNDYQKAYCSAKQFLIDHIDKQITHSPKKISMAPLTWFQSSYNYGQLIDIITQINSLFASPHIRQALVQRIIPQLREGSHLGSGMRKMLTKNARNSSIYAIATSPQLLPSWLCAYQCDRQVSAYSRYALQLAAYYSSTSTSTQFENLFIMIMDFIANRLLELIIQEPDCQDKQRVIESISLNFWKTIRALQTKKNLRLFTTVIKNYMPFILHYYHLNISTPEYVRQYMISIRLVLACKEYLPSNLFAEVQGILKINEILTNLMKKTSEKPSYYTVLLYCLNFYAELMKKQRNKDSQRNRNLDDAQSSLFDHKLSENKQFVGELRSLYLIVNQTINPVNNSLKKSSLGRKSIKIEKQVKNLNELSKDVTIISLMMFFKLYIPHHMDTQGYSGQQSLYDLLFNADQSNYQVGFNFKSLLLNIETNPTRKSIQLALKIGNNSRHYIQFVSVCNHLYKALAQEKTYSHDGLVQQILAFIQRILDLQITTNANKYNETWISLAYMKSWACNLLYVMMGYSASDTLMSKISDIAFTSNNLLSLLGELLSIFGECEIKWPWVGIRTINLSKLGLLEKQLLHSILKLYMSLFSKVDKWNKRTTSQVTNKNTIYVNFCKAVIGGSKLLNKNPATVINQNQYGDRVLRNATIPSNSAKTQYQQTLQKITLQSIYSPYIARDLQSRPLQNPQIQASAVQLSKIRVIHPQCSNILDLIHEHYNLLITEKYLMMMQGSYLNPQLILDTYQFNDILSIFENSSKRIIDINNNDRTFHEAMNKIHRDVWRSFRMNTNLYYLNTIEESPKDTVDILNSIAQVCVNSIVTLRGVMEMHQDFRQFFIKADKIMRQARKASSIYSFDIKNYIEQGGFDHKSQYGQSFMLSPSTMRVGR